MELPFDEYGNPRFFPPDTHVLSNHAEYRQAANNPAVDSFVRSIFLGYAPPRHLSLGDVLTLADTERQRLAQMCGAAIVDVELGFISTNPEEDIQFDDGKLIPPGVRLVGRVPVIRHFVCFDDPEFDKNHSAYIQTQKGIAQYRSELKAGNYYATLSALIHQFGLADDGTIWLIDADQELSIQ